MASSTEANNCCKMQQVYKGVTLYTRESFFWRPVLSLYSKNLFNRRQINMFFCLKPYYEYFILISTDASKIITERGKDSKLNVFECPKYDRVYFPYNAK